jgi:hypothetical protein
MFQRGILNRQVFKPELVKNEDLPPFLVLALTAAPQHQFELTVVLQGEILFAL